MKKIIVLTLSLGVLLTINYAHSARIPSSWDGYEQIDTESDPGLSGQCKSLEGGLVGRGQNMKGLWNGIIGSNKIVLSPSYTSWVDGENLQRYQSGSNAEQLMAMCGYYCSKKYAGDSWRWRYMNNYAVAACSENKGYCKCSDKQLIDE